MRRQKIKKINTKRGITLIALIITIVLMLILTAVTVNMAINGGIFEYAKNAKTNTEIEGEKEFIQMAAILAKGSNETGRVTVEEMQKGINNVLGENLATALDNGDTIVVKFNNSERYYEVNQNCKVEKIDIVFDRNAGNITVGLKGEHLEGTATKPFEIWCIEDLIEWSNNYNKYLDKNIKLCQTLDFKTILSYENSDRTDFGDINGDGKVDILIEEIQKGNGFIPIRQFNGTFDGNKKEIKNLYINIDGDAGLFSFTSGNARIMNLKITGQITSKNGYASGIVATRNTGQLTIENCCNKSVVNGMLGAGGILGIHNILEGNLELINCYNEGEIKSNNSAGGITSGIFQNALVKNCFNLEKIQSNREAGGIVGKIDSQGDKEIKILNCYNEEGITGVTSVGGIVGGTSKKVSVSNSFNLGKITSTGNDLNYSFAGGIIGYNNGITQIDNCYNIGVLSATKKSYTIGTQVTTINNCFYSSELTSEIQVVEKGLTDIAEKNISEFVELLNLYKDEKGNYPEDWKMWKVGNVGYPVFK